MLPLPWLLASSLLLQVAPANAAEVLADGGKVTVRAERLPLTQLLDRMSRKTGMKVTYEGPRPSMIVSLDVDGMTEVAAVLKLMEGLGISYVLQTDATGERVDLLILSTTAGPGALVAAAEPSKYVDPPAEEPIEAYSHIPLDPAVLEASGGAGPPNLNNPYMGLPPQHFPQALQQAMEQPQEPPPPPPPAPHFPQGSSYPVK